MDAESDQNRQGAAPADAAGTPEAARLSEAMAALSGYPLVDAIRQRRSRRFSVGAQLPGGGLAHASASPPQPLGPEEEALLALAAAGISGFCLSELPMDAGGDPDGGGGNVMAALTGRTIASADAVHATTLFVINDEATWMMKRPQDFGIDEIDGLRHAAAQGDLAGVYERSRVKVRDGRTAIARQTPGVPPFNRWSTNLPGTTYFLPVCDLTAMYINVILSCFDEQVGMFMRDERRGLKPAGVGRHAMSKGGTLHNDLGERRTITVVGLEALVVEFVLAEQAFMAHNLSLMEQAMGLGGWTHLATGGDTVWMEALGFTMGSQMASRMMAASTFKRRLMRLTGKDVEIPFALGLTLDGQDLIRPYCPPYYDSMEEAVFAFVRDKKSAFCEAAIAPGTPGTWKNREHVQQSVAPFSEATIAATIDYCTYLHSTYGRFPAHFGPMRTTLAHQAHHLDLAFYDQHFEPGAYTETQKRHDALWHRS